MFADAQSKGDLDAHAVAELPSSKAQQSPQHIWPPHGPLTSSSNGGEGTVYLSAPSNPSQFNASSAPLIVSTQAASVGGPPNATSIRPSSLRHWAPPPQVPADWKIPVNVPVALGPIPVPSAEHPEGHHADAMTGPRRSTDGGMRIAGGKWEARVWHIPFRLPTIFTQADQLYTTSVGLTKTSGMSQSMYSPRYDSI